MDDPLVILRRLVEDMLAAAARGDETVATDRAADVWHMMEVVRRGRPR